MTILTEALNENKETALEMIEQVLEQEQEQLPEGKTIENFGGGYVECIKTKAKLVLYFGFDDKRNRCQIVLDIEKDEVLLWLQAIAERVWNKTKNTPKYRFGDKTKVKTKLKKSLLDID